MSCIKCFDVVSMVADEATKQFSPLWVLDKEKYDILKQYCGSLDVLAKEFESESFEAEVDDIEMTISITMECPDIVIYTAKHIFCELVERTVRFGFSVSENGDLNVKFVFPSVWDKA